MQYQVKQRRINYARQKVLSKFGFLQTIYEDGYVMYNDGWFIVECDEAGGLYVDVAGRAVRDCPDYKNMEYVMDAACKEVHEQCLLELAEVDN